MGRLVSAPPRCKAHGSCADTWRRMDCLRLHGLPKWAEPRLWGVGWHGYHEEGVEGYRPSQVTATLPQPKSPGRYGGFDPSATDATMAVDNPFEQQAEQKRPCIAANPRSKG